MKKLLIITYICLCGVSSVFADTINDYYAQSSLATFCISTKEARDFFNNSQNSKYIEAYNAVSASVKKHYGVDMENVTHFGAFVLPSFGELSFVAFLTGKLPDVNSWSSVVKAFVEDKEGFDEAEKFEMPFGDKTISVFAFGDFVFLPVSNELMLVTKINVFKQIRGNKIKFDKASENFKKLIESGKSFFIADKNWLDMLNKINQNAFSFMKATSKDSYIVWLNECLGDIKKVDFVDFTATNDSAIMRLNFVNPEDVEVIKKGIEKKLKEKSDTYKKSFEGFCDSNKHYDVYYFTNRIPGSFFKLKAEQYIERFKIDYEKNSVSFTFDYTKHLKQVEFFLALYNHLTAMFDSVDSGPRNLCLSNQDSLKSAVDKYNQEHNIAMSVINIPLLVKLGYLRAPIEKGQCEWVLFKDLGFTWPGHRDSYSICCLKHGRKMPWGGEHLSKRDILNQSECYKNQTELQLALFKYNRSDDGIMQELDIEKLIEKGFLDKTVVKPEKNCEYFINHEVGKNGCVQCKKHVPVFNQISLNTAEIASDKSKCFTKQKELMEAINKYNSEKGTPMDKPDYYELEREKYIKSSWPYTMKSFTLCDICCEGNLTNGGYIYCKYHGSAFNDLKNPEPRKEEDIEYDEPIAAGSSDEKKPESILLNAKDKAIAYAKKLYKNLPKEWKKAEHKAADGTIHFMLNYKEEGNCISGRIKDDEWILDEITGKASFLTEAILGEPVIGMSKTMIDYLTCLKEAESDKHVSYTDYMYELESMKGYHTEFFISNREDEVFMWCVELKPENKDKTTSSLEMMCMLKMYLNSYYRMFSRYPHLGTEDRDFDSTAYNAEEILNWTDANKNVLTNNQYNPDFGINNYIRRYRSPIIDCEPSKVMCDKWNNKIQYIAEGNNLWLWSYGPDGQAAGKTIAEAQNNAASDDIIISVYTFKKPLH